MASMHAKHIIAETSVNVRDGRPSAAINRLSFVRPVCGLRMRGGREAAIESSVTLASRSAAALRRFRPRATTGSSRPPARKKPASQLPLTMTFWPSPVPRSVRLPGLNLFQPSSHPFNDYFKNFFYNRSRGHFGAHAPSPGGKGWDEGGQLFARQRQNLIRQKKSVVHRHFAARHSPLDKL
jgi:hypothetical protein